MPPLSSLRHVRALSLDVTGTLIRHLDPIAETYSQAMTWSHFPKPITPEGLKKPFKAAYKKTLLEYPYFGATQGLSSRQWWVKTVRSVLDEAGLEEGKDYEERDFNRWFRRVYQHYGCPAGYVPMKDALPFLDWAVSQGYLLAVTTNTPVRTMDSVLPFMGLHQYFRTFTCSQDCGSEKPEPGIYQHSFEEMSRYSELIMDGIIEEDFVREFDPASFNSAKVIAVNKYQKFWFGEGSKLEPDQILHIGDSFAADLCGPKSVGWHGIHLDRSGDPNVRQYQDWLSGPDYEGKCEADIAANTVLSLDEVRQKLEEACK